MADYKPGYEYECAYCGQANELAYYRDDEPQYCGNVCSGKANSEESRFNVECDHCGQPTTVDSYTYERNDSYFCNRDCWQESLRTRIGVECEVCGKSESVTPTKAKTYRACSRECLNEIQSDEFSGSGNPNHQFDISDNELSEMYEKGDSTITIAEKTGMSTRNAALRLENCGVDLRDSGWPKNTETEFGLKVRSELEKTVAELLYSRGINFEYEPSFPGPYLPDFVVDDELVVEVWGVVGEEYEKRRSEKESWYSENGYSVIGLEPTNHKTVVEKIENRNE